MIIVCLNVVTLRTLCKRNLPQEMIQKLHVFRNICMYNKLQYNNQNILYLILWTHGVYYTYCQSILKY